jgi:hypothetical protein
LPGTSGLEFLRLIRAEFDDLPFFLITDDTSEVLTKEAISLGVTDYVRTQELDSGYDRFADSVLRTVTARRTQSMEYRTLSTSACRIRTLPDALHRLSAATSGSWIDQFLVEIVRDELSYPVAELFHRHNVEGICRFRTDGAAIEGNGDIVPDGDSPETASLSWSTRPVTDPADRTIGDVPDSIRIAAKQAPVDDFIVLSPTHRSIPFGTLLVGKNDGSFETDAITVLETLASTAGLARGGIDYERLLLADAVTELDFLIRDPRVFPVALSAELDCTWTLEGINPSAYDTYCHSFPSKTPLSTIFGPTSRTTLSPKTTVQWSSTGPTTGVPWSTVPAGRYSLDS